MHESRTVTAVPASLFPDEYPSFATMLPVADLMPYLERACLQHTTRGFARLLVQRIGGTFETRYRMLERLRAGDQPQIQERIADELAVGLGLHASLIWPTWWTAA